MLWSEELVLGLSGLGLKAVATKAGASASFADMRPGKYYVAAFRGIDMGLRLFDNLRLIGDRIRHFPDGLDSADSITCRRAFSLFRT